MSTSTASGAGPTNSGGTPVATTADYPPLMYLRCITLAAIPSDITMFNLGKELFHMRCGLEAFSVYIRYYRIQAGSRPDLSKLRKDLDTEEAAVKDFQKSCADVCSLDGSPDLSDTSSDLAAWQTRLGSLMKNEGNSNDALNMSERFKGIIKQWKDYKNDDRRSTKFKQILYDQGVLPWRQLAVQTLPCISAVSSCGTSQECRSWELLSTQSAAASRTSVKVFEFLDITLGHMAIHKKVGLVKLCKVFYYFVCITTKQLTMKHLPVRANFSSLARITTDQAEALYEYMRSKELLESLDEARMQDYVNRIFGLLIMNANSLEGELKTTLKAVTLHWLDRSPASLAIDVEGYANLLITLGVPYNELNSEVFELKEKHGVAKDFTMMDIMMRRGPADGPELLMCNLDFQRRVWLPIEAHEGLSISRDSLSKFVPEWTARQKRRHHRTAQQIHADL